MARKEGQMAQVIRRSRGLLIALVVLGLSAGFALAARPMPEAAADGLATAAAAAGKTVPVGNPGVEDPTQGTETEDPEAEDPETEDPEATVEDGAHGDLVAEAAQMETPDGFANHGEFVSCVARMNHGHEPAEEPSEPVDLADVTPELCEQLAEDAREARGAAQEARAAARETRAAEREATAAERAAAKAARSAGKTSHGGGPHR
jgi:hypothetical protein